MLSASRMACLIEATVESMLTITPFFRPREGCVPTPMTAGPSGVTSPTTAAILVVPMSSPTMMSEDLRGMEVPHLHGVFRGPQIFYSFVSVGRRRRGPEPQAARRVARAADQLELAQHPPRSRLRTIAAQLQLAAALRTRRRARLDLRDRGRRDVDGRVEGRTRQLPRQPLGHAHVLAQRALALAP